jgi:hypothetical protein
MPSFRGPVVRTFAVRIFPAIFILIAVLNAHAQSGNAGVIQGTVTDGSGAVIPGAEIHLLNQISQFDRTAVSDATGQFSFSNVPFNPYHLSVKASGFAPFTEDVELRSAVGTNLKVAMQITGGSSTVTVEAGGGDLVEGDPTFHTDVSRELFEKVPLESQSSGLSALVTQTSPGVAADSNGLFHGLGDHASNSFSIDGQSITDQQSKVFSNQLPTNAVQSLEVISGAPPAEYGGKTSLVIVATTRSGQGVTTPTGSIHSSYGTFGSASGGVDLSYGGKNWGNFFEGDAQNSGRFLDGPEFAVFHDKGNEENFFDRVDYTFSPVDSMHMDLNYSRSWFQTPNSYDNLNVENVVSGGTSASPVYGNVGEADQRSKIGTFNIAPTYTHVVNNYSVWNLGAFVRKDLYNYFPSGNPLADLGPSDLQTSSISQIRTLMNTAVHSDYTYVRGINNIKVGVQYGQTFLRESDNLGIVESTYNAPCMDASGNPLPGYSSSTNCADAGVLANTNFIPVLAPYDLTRGGSEYYFFGHTDVKELAMYIEDQIKAGNWNFNLGIRGDMYNGLAIQRQAEPRLGVAYNIKQTSTVLAVSYARTLETPFNENLVLSSQGCSNTVLAPLLACQSGVTGVVSKNLEPGFRNEFHASLQQAFGKHAVVSGEYIWKYTHNAFDFSVLGNTPITFPIDWHSSKIPGFAIRAEMPEIHGVSAYFVTSSVAARFFPPQVAGAGATSGASVGYPFRIDHDERFNETTHLQYTFSHAGFFNNVWGGFNWRFDSGMVAGSAPCYNLTDPNSACGNSSITLPGGQAGVALVDNAIPATTNPVTGAAVALLLTADQEFQSGLACNGVKATPTNPLPATCPADELTSSLLRIPADGKGDNDKDPPRIAPRSLFDASIGDDNIFHGDKKKWSLHLTAVNVTNKYALYNFLSTFSGTHYVTPRAMSAEVGFHF